MDPSNSDGPHRTTSTSTSTTVPSVPSRALAARPLPLTDARARRRPPNRIDPRRDESELDVTINVPIAPLADLVTMLR